MGGTGLTKRTLSRSVAFPWLERLQPSAFTCYVFPLPAAPRDEGTSATLVRHALCTLRRRWQSIPTAGNDLLATTQTFLRTLLTSVSLSLSPHTHASLFPHIAPAAHQLLCPRHGPLLLLQPHASDAGSCCIHAKSKQAAGLFPVQPFCRCDSRYRCKPTTLV